MREWETRLPPKESVDESKPDKRKSTKELEPEKYQSDTGKQVEDKEAAAQKPSKAPSTSPDTSPLKPTPAPPHKMESVETQQQQHQKKQVNFNEFENGLAPPDPWDPPITIKEELQELKDGTLELVPTVAVEKQILETNIEGTEQPNLDASMESVGIEAAKLASLYFDGASSETVIEAFKCF